MTLKSFDCYPALHESRPVGHEQGQAQLAKGQPPQPGAQKRELARGVPKQGEGGDHLDILDSDADVTLDMFTYVCFAVPCFLNLFEVSLQVLSYIFHHFSYYLHKSCSMIPRGSTCPGSATSRIATPSGS